MSAFPVSFTLRTERLTISRGDCYISFKSGETYRICEPSRCEEQCLSLFEAHSNQSKIDVSYSQSLSDEDRLRFEADLFVKRNKAKALTVSDVFRTHVEPYRAEVIDISDHWLSKSAKDFQGQREKVHGDLIKSVFGDIEPDKSRDTCPTALRLKVFGPDPEKWKQEPLTVKDLFGE